MSKYKLTTDLISDCIALIPQNLERLNQRQDVFKIKLIAQKNIGIAFRGFEEFGYVKFNDYLASYASTLEKSQVISHCLRVIPEFQVESPEYKQVNFEAIFLEEEYKKYKYSDKERAEYCWSKCKYMTEKTQNMYKTIASATLHGQGEFPPSTLEELCESYKNVTSK